MAIREIKLLGDPVLREPAQEVVGLGEDVKVLVKDMLETMYHAEGIGLAAPQVGVSSRVIVVDLRGAEEDPVGLVALVNPRVVESSRKKDRAPEGCLSIPGMEEVVERPSSVTVEGLDPEGEPVSLEVSGLLARALQHEIDHLLGKVFIDRMTDMTQLSYIKEFDEYWVEEKVADE